MIFYALKDTTTITKTHTTIEGGIAKEMYSKLCYSREKFRASTSANNIEYVKTALIVLIDLWVIHSSKHNF